ncbi:MAG: PUA domain-containing protein [Candidatus Hermodarchaeia archaeon]|jgi:PUA domain protein
MRIKHRTLLRTKELRQLRKQLEKFPNLEHKALQDTPSRKVQVERVVLDDKSELNFVGGELWLVIQQDLIFPGLPALLSENVELPKVIVDMGAVSHIANGADVMAPGIFDLDKKLVEGNLAVIIDQKNLVPLAVGRMRLSAETILEINKGRAIDTLHYVGDPLWKLAKELSE